MKKTTNKNITKFLGILFIIWGVASIIDGVIEARWGAASILWLSYVALLVIGIGILRRDSSLIASQIAIIGIPYVLWNIDFFYNLFTQKSLWGITDYFFTQGPLISKIIPLQHVFNIPLSLYAIYLIGLKRKDFWRISIMEIAILFVITRLATTYDENVNCIYHNCANFDLGIFYPIEWFAALIIVIFVTRSILIKCFYKKEK